jgi:hypothetical protein
MLDRKGRTAEAGIRKDEKEDVVEDGGKLLSATAHVVVGLEGTEGSNCWWETRTREHYKKARPVKKLPLRKLQTKRYCSGASIDGETSATSCVDASTRIGHKHALMRLKLSPLGFF